MKFKSFPGERVIFSEDRILIADENGIISTDVADEIAELKKIFQEVKPEAAQAKKE